MLNQDEISKVINDCNEKNAILIAVTKTRSLEDIRELSKLGLHSFGENRVQELLSKKDELPESIEWHLIGHLQKNKVKYIAPFIHLIHSIDSLKLLKEVNKQAVKNGRVINCLLQFHVAKEESKFGINPNDLDQFLNELNLSEFPNVCIQGIMGMASFVEDESQVRQEFQELKRIFTFLKQGMFTDVKEFNVISMGMSGDYELALEEGSTMVRVGSKLFN